MDLYTLAIDLSKNYFQIHGIDQVGRRILKKKLTRKQFIEFLPQIPKCQVVFEAGSSAHYWARKFKAMGRSKINSSAVCKTIFEIK